MMDGIPIAADRNRKEGLTIPFSRSRIFAHTVLAVVLLAATGCYKATFYSDPQVVRGAEHDQWSNF